MKFNKFPKGNCLFGLYNKCKQCKRKTDNLYIQNNKIKVSKRAKKYRIKHRTKIIKYLRKYYVKRKKYLLQEKHKYYIKNKIHLNKYIREYYKKYKKRISIQSKQYRIKNKNRLSIKQKKYLIKNKIALSIKAKERYEKSKNVILKRQRKYYLKTRKKRIAQGIIYTRNRLKTDINFKILRNLRKRVWDALKDNCKSTSTIDLLGCSIKHLKKHIESHFKSGMSWNNYGYYGWHVDHKIPCASFDLSKPEEQRKCFNYTNLQPLWMKENISKGKKIIWK
jgi:hypothetical protein